ncbi:hypothetical protein ACQR16_15085 [Bradyrhizobium oligotrophicum]|uniref:hypothetical protein n=1 Tax=Bradyrhizobium oligotrophicum TaxID=44255 RepID=UPI003EB9C640
MIAHMSCKSAIAYIEGIDRSAALVATVAALARGLQALTAHTGGEVAMMTSAADIGADAIPVAGS